MSFKNTMVTASDFSRQLDATFKQLDRVLVDYNRKDRKRITRKAAQKIAVAARRNPGFNDSKRPHTRKDGNRTITYNPGNLRRSLKVLPIRKSLDSFVGPQFARKKATSYGAVGQPVDGYYAAMLFGSALNFQRRVLIPALRRGFNAALKILRSETEKQIATRGVRRGLNITR